MNVDPVQFGFMPSRGTTDALLVLRRMQEEKEIKIKSYLCTEF